MQTDYKEINPVPKISSSEPKPKQQGHYWNNHNIVPPITTRPSAEQYSSERGNKNDDSVEQFLERNKAAANHQMSDAKSIDTSNYAPKNSSNESPKHEYQWKPAAGYSYLPTKPVPLTKDQEFFIIDKLARELTGCGLEQVRAVYQEVAANDHQLSGWTGFADFGLALQKHGVSF